MKSTVSVIAVLALYIPACAGYTQWSYTNESELPYYGQSPPVYPSRRCLDSFVILQSLWYFWTAAGEGTSNSAWAAAYAKARAIVSQLTLDEKVNVTQGYTGACAGNAGALTRFNIDSRCFSDAPDGIRGQEFVSAFPAGIHVAATFDRSLLYEYGKALGSEFRGKGINVALAPVAGPLGRVARGGRNWEGLSADPYLAGAGMGAITKGIQEQGVIATAKVSRNWWRGLLLVLLL